MTVFLRSLAYNLAATCFSVGLQILCLPALLGPRSWIVPVGHTWLDGLLWILDVVAGVRCEVRGREHLPAGAYLIASKHQSALETFVLPRAVRRPGFVLKRELLWLPLFGCYLKRYGAVPVDRQGGAAALRRMLREARAIAAEGRPIVIYPEGTRVPPGTSRPYHPGVAALYRELGLPVVPVALNTGYYWRKRAFRKLPGRPVIEFLPPIEPGLSRRDFMDRLHDSIESGCRRLDAEAPRPGSRLADCG